MRHAGGGKSKRKRLVIGCCQGAGKTGNQQSRRRPQMRTDEANNQRTDRSAAHMNMEINKMSAVLGSLLGVMGLGMFSKICSTRRTT
ncbi:MAG: hypothetical protein U1E30_02995 [Rhodoblastus sp.]